MTNAFGDLDMVRAFNLEARDMLALNLDFEVLSTDFDVATLADIVDVACDCLSNYMYMLCILVYTFNVFFYKHVVRLSSSFLRSSNNPAERLKV